MKGPGGTGNLPALRLDAPVVLLAGPGSRRLERLAVGLAARHVCRRGFEAPPCDETCPDCRRTLAGEHPDLLVAAPESARRLNTPAFEGGGSKETTIPTALVRAVVAEATKLPYEAPRRAVVLLDVDRTEAAAYSALLKVLEEPPQRTRFLLTATRPRLLPPTILSRVALIPLRGLSREETAGALRERGLGGGEAEARASFVPDDPEEAAALDLAAARAHRDALLEALSGLFLTGSAAWALTLGALLSGDDNEETGRHLALSARLLRDAAAAAVDPAGHTVVHRERFRDLARLGESAGDRLLPAAQRALVLASDLTESPLNARLQTESFALSLVLGPA